MAPRNISHGIGGAGNIWVDDTAYIDGIYYSPPVLSPSKSARYTTGIGGTGNMRKFNTTDVLVTQDYPCGLDHIPVSHSAGIGGWGNLKAMKKHRTQSNKGKIQDPPIGPLLLWLLSSLRRKSSVDRKI